jgi:hypothetical protein
MGWPQSFFGVCCRDAGTRRATYAHLRRATIILLVLRLDRGPPDTSLPAAYDDAFNKFFARLAADGIARQHLVRFTAERATTVGGALGPAGCDGVNVPCTYAQIGEINTNLAGLLATEQSITTPFTVHSDDAPTIYITGNPSRTDPIVRNFAHGLAALTAANPITGNTDTISQFLADPVEMKLLHMVTADPARTPTPHHVRQPRYASCSQVRRTATRRASRENPGFAWNHGDDRRTSRPPLEHGWSRREAAKRRPQTWSDHATSAHDFVHDGPDDGFSHDGRVLAQKTCGAMRLPAESAATRWRSHCWRKLTTTQRTP